MIQFLLKDKHFERYISLYPSKYQQRKLRNITEEIKKKGLPGGNPSSGHMACDVINYIPT